MGKKAEGGMKNVPLNGDDLGPTRTDTPPQTSQPPSESFPPMGDSLIKLEDSSKYSASMISQCHPPPQLCVYEMKFASIAEGTDE